MNFRGLSYLDHNPITSIGGFTHGVRNADMAAAVNTLVSGGAYHSPTNVTKITQRSSDSVVYDRSEEASPQVYTPQASYQMLGMMKSAVGLVVKLQVNMVTLVIHSLQLKQNNGLLH